MNFKPSELAQTELYLDLMKKCLTRYIFPDQYRPLTRPSIRNHPMISPFYPLMSTTLAALGWKLCREVPFDLANRANGKDLPPEADTMVGLERLNNLQYCVTEVLRKGIPGDLIETGVWRGGASIFMRAILKAHGDPARIVWLADSFEGLPKPDGRYPEDAGDKHWERKATLGIPLVQVRANFERYGLLDERVCFLAGWFKDTLPTAPIDRLAILRLDGDMYSSTMDGLTNLYSKLSVGGYAIVDDYGAVPGCKQAVDDFRARHQLAEPLERIDWTGVFWEKRQ